MRILRIEIERFMGLRRVVLELDPRLQLIAGPNNSGKTTIFRALEFFFNPDSFDLARVRPQNDYYRAEGPRALTRVRVYVGELSNAERQAFHAAVTARSRRFWVEVRMSKGGRKSYQASRSQPGRELHQRLLDYLDVVHVPAVRVERGKTPGDDSERLAATLRDVLIRSRPGPETKIQKQFGKLSRSAAKLLTSVLERSESHIAELALPGVDLEFQMPPPAELWASALNRVRLRRSGTEIELRDEGTGIQSLLSFGILRYAASRERSLSHVFLIEEPEAFLHPQLQRAIAAQLELLSKSAQVIATTHSPIIIDSLDIRRIARLKRDPAGLRYKWAPEQIGDVEAAKLRRHCDVKNSELVFARKVVFCEGLSDAGAIAELVGAPLAEHDVAVIAMGSADVAEYFVKLAKRFQIEHLVVLDKDKIAVDRTTLRKLAIASGHPLSPHDEQQLDALGQRRCKTNAHATQWRADADLLLSQRKVYCIGNDIEGAVAFSYRKDRLLLAMGPQNGKHLSAQSVAELQNLTGARSRERLRQLVGSKGWNNQPAQSDHKLKQHLPKAVINLLGSPRRNSDLAALRHSVKTFAES